VADQGLRITYEYKPVTKRAGGEPVRLVECQTCFSVVLDNHTREHSEYHIMTSRRNDG
jgi:hypothetical protein